MSDVMNVVVVGGGAAGMMAAVAAADAGLNDAPDAILNVILIEKNEKLGKKLFITGKGRCNVTNACEVEDLFGNVMEHSKFLFGAVYGFDNRAVIDFFEKAGCPLKIERGQRVFPVSDHSSDIIRALERELKRLGVRVMLNTEVEKIVTAPLGGAAEGGADNQSGKKDKKKCALRISKVRLYDKITKKKSEIDADCAIIATGGQSYVLTGSTGDGYRFARECGHSVTQLGPSLVPFAIKEKWCHELQGLSLKNVQVSVEVGGKQIYSDFGEMLFTHYGVSGPLILSASSHYAHKVRKDEAAGARLLIDLKPALTHEQLDRRVLREFDGNKNKQFKNVINSLFPAKLSPLMPLLSGIDPEKKVNEVTKEERGHLVRTIKCMELTITGLGDFDEAVVTKGGVSLNEVSSSTMESKIVKGLYFAGEVLDVDALTGGFNLQIAWSTGHLAGASAAAGK